MHEICGFLRVLRGPRDRVATRPMHEICGLLDDPSPFPDSPDFVHLCRWYWAVDGEHVDATDRQIIVLVELDKVRGAYNELSEDVLQDKLLAWSYLVTSGFKNESEVRSIVDSYPDIEEFAELYGLAVNDPKVVRAYQDAKSAVLEYNNRQEYFAKLEKEARERGESEGLEKGMAEGRKETAEEIANRLRAMGVDESVIAEATRDLG